MKEIQEKFISNPDVCYKITGVNIFVQLISEINNGTFVGTSRPLTKQRKTSSSFKDASLKEIFLTTTSGLNSLYSSLPLSQSQADYLIALFNLAKACLTFDYLGNGNDESQEETTVHLPTSWREIIVNGEIFNNFIKWYDKGLPGTMTSPLMTCIAQIASIRRTVFSANERTDHIQRLVSGMIVILENPSPLNDADTYHEFCRFLNRIKASYQLNELVNIAEYKKWMECIIKFTINSVSNGSVSANSLYYVLTFWQKMACSVPYVRLEKDHFLDKFSSEICVSYIKTRYQAISEYSNKNSSFNNSTNLVGLNPYEEVDQDQIEQQLEAIASLARCQYNTVCEQVYEMLVNVRHQLENPTDTIYQQCSWLIQVVSSLIGSRVTSLASDKTDSSDAMLIKLTFEIIQVADSRYGQNGQTFQDSKFELEADDLDEKDLLQLSIVYFFAQFKRIYIGEQMAKTCPVYVMLNETYNLENESAVLKALLQKIISNLKYQIACVPVVTDSIKILNSLSQGYTSARQMAKIEMIKDMLAKGLIDLPLGK